MCQIVVCERQSDWASLLRREKWRVRETRSLDDCWSQVAELGIPKMALIDIRCGSLEALFEGADRMRQSYSDLLLLAIAPETARFALWRPLCEIGMVHAVSSFRDLPGLRSVVSRHIQRFPQKPLSLEKRIWNNLAWPSKSSPAT